MTTYNQRLARRTRNTFAPAKRVFQKAVAQAPGIFNKAKTGTQKFFTKTLPSVGRQIGRGLEEVGGTMSAVANSPIAQAVAAFNPELAPALGGLSTAGQSIRGAGGVVKSGSKIGVGLSKDVDTAQNQLLERAKAINNDSSQLKFM
jgi:hypothetical protein